MSKLFVALMLMCGIASAEPVKLGTANTVTIRGEISSESMIEAAKKLVHLDSIRGNRGYPIYLVFDSPGGDIVAGEEFIEIAKTLENVQTITVFAASMASAIVEAMPGRRLVLSSGILMFHRAAGQVSGQFETGEMESRLDFYKRFVRRMEQRNADRMSLSLKKYKSQVKDELWLTSGDAINKGAADEIVSLQCSQKLMDEKQTIVQDLMIYQVKLDYSGCPLFRTPSVSEGQSEQVVEAYHKWKGILYEDHQKY